MAYSSPTNAAFDLLRHVPPKDVEERMFDVFDLNEDVVDVLLSSVDIPLKICTDANPSFIQCDYNRDGDSYRSPVDNKYYPPLSDGQKIPEKLRQLEILGNKAFQAYVKLYFGNAEYSVYCWEISDDAFGLGVFVRKDVDDMEENFKGTISCSDVFTITSEGKDQYEYQLVSSILLEVTVGLDGKGEPIILSGGCADSKTQKHSAKDNVQQLANAGRMIEDNCSNFMEYVKQIYVSKMQEILSYTKKSGVGASNNADLLAAALKARMGK